MSKTNKELTPLEALNIIIHQFSVDDFPLLEYTRIIKKALKQAQKDKEMLDIFKNSLTIKRGGTNVIYNDCGGLVEILFDVEKNELDEQLRKSLREWVLENAFPKELKALEIIKSEFEISFNDKKQTIQFQSVEEPYTHIRFSLTREIKDKEKYDSLKEVLL